MVDWCVGGCLFACLLTCLFACLFGCLLACLFGSLSSVSLPGLVGWVACWEGGSSSWQWLGGA